MRMVKVRLLNSLQWRHDERDGVSNHQPHDCFKAQIQENTKASSHWPLSGEFTDDMWKKYPFDDAIVGFESPCMLPWYTIFHHSMGFLHLQIHNLLIFYLILLCLPAKLIYIRLPYLHSVKDRLHFVT